MSGPVGCGSQPIAVRTYQIYSRTSDMAFINENYEWSFPSSHHSDKKYATSYKPTNWNILLKSPDVSLRIMDVGRTNEVDTFYKLCQQHREQYKSHISRIHPLRYFRKSNNLWQCAPDITRTYFEYPQYHLQYKNPVVLPITYKRTKDIPLMPERNLAGRYDAGSDFKYL
ncbi:uncharacterized protein LOC142321245 [Lycorma delicatula]|uniref:uncharacterized protein LOC142321245 n=1 Tax=Lycorma delicatula TaxID=130591 RepID=UPI003F51540F